MRCTACGVYHAVFTTDHRIVHHALYTMQHMLLLPDMESHLRLPTPPAPPPPQALPPSLPSPHKEMHTSTASVTMSLTRPGLCKQMTDGEEGAGPLTPLVTPLGVVAASLVRRLQLAAIHLHRGGLGQYCLNVSVCHWVLLLLGLIKHLHVQTQRWANKLPFES